MNVLERNKDTIYNILLLAGFIVILFLTFYKLGYASLMDWDEARHGVNAYELIQDYSLNRVIKQMEEIY